MSRPADAEAWGRRIRRRREKLYLTQAELAAKITELSEGAFGVDQSSVSRWETGSSAPYLRLRPLIATALGTDPDLLFEPSPVPDEPWAKAAP